MSREPPRPSDFIGKESAQQPAHRQKFYTAPVPRAFRKPDEHDVTRDIPVALGYIRIVRETHAARLFELEEFGERWISHSVLVDMGKLSIVIPTWMTLGWTEDASIGKKNRSTQRKR
jgi:hypothetical protein